MNGEFLRLVESIHKDKGIDRDLLFSAVEQGIASAAKKRLGGLDVVVTVDRNTGAIHAVDVDGKPVDVSDLGRIAARTAYQVMTQRIREAESSVVYDEFQSKVGHIVAGSVQRFERGDMMVALDRTEAVLPRREQVDIESYRVGDHIRALLLEINRQRSKVRVILSRAKEEFVSELFRMEVPEIQEGTVVVKKLVREPGHRTKIAVESVDPRVDPVGACVGVRGSRIRSIVDELHGEHIDIVPYSPDVREFIMSALQPVRVVNIDLDEEAHRASVIVDKEDLSRAIGRRGQNIRLTSRVVEWEVDVAAEEGEEGDEAAEEDAADSGKAEGEEAGSGKAEGEEVGSERAEGEEAEGEKADSEEVGSERAEGEDAEGKEVGSERAEGEEETEADESDSSTAETGEGG